MALDLLLIHGRFDPNEQMEDWGFSGPTIQGVEAIHVTYQSTYVLWFADRIAADRAHTLTGWRYWDDRALEMSFHDDMLKTVNCATDSPAAFYGDWELQVPKH